MIRLRPRHDVVELAARERQLLGSLDPRLRGRRKGLDQFGQAMFVVSGHKGLRLT